jgi:hypothetical protein
MSLAAPMVGVHNTLLQKIADAEKMSPDARRGSMIPSQFSNGLGLSDLNRSEFDSDKVSRLGV